MSVTARVGGQIPGSGVEAGGATRALGGPRPGSSGPSPATSGFNVPAQVPLLGDGPGAGTDALLPDGSGHIFPKSTYAPVGGAFGRSAGILASGSNTLTSNDNTLVRIASSAARC